MDDNVGIPDDLRCKRSDGKQWRCTAMSMPDKTVCEKHYIQAKKRAANSALRASLKRAKRRSLDPGSDAAYLDDTSDRDMSVSPLRNASGGGGDYSSPSSGKKSREKAMRGAQGDMYSSPDALKAGPSGRGVDSGQADEHRTGSVFSTPPRGKPANCYSRDSAGDYSGRSTDSSDKAEGLTCHQCRRSDRSRVSWCMKCVKRGFCDSCLAKWYNGISMEEARAACPVCRGICSCKSCRRGDSLIKARIRDISTLDKLRYLHSLLAFVLPALKKIDADQGFELELENRVYGVTSSIPRARINPDEQMCCDICGIPIIDYHRHCTSCSTDICLDCCKDIRKPAAKRGHIEPSNVREVPLSILSSETSGEPVLDDHIHMKDYCLDFLNLFHKWKVTNNGSILCPGHRCNSPLVLRRIFKINWATKLVKSAEEMVNGCKVTDLSFSEKCISCSAGLSRELNELILHKCSYRDLEKESTLYCPTSEDIKHDTYIHFRRHWVNGEPVIVRQVIDSSLTSQWDPRKILRGVKETSNERIKEDNMLVKAHDCLTHSEVEIELDDFIRGYYDGNVKKTGMPQILKLKDWPHSEALEDFLICHIPEIFSKLPLLEYIHSKWGLLNLSSKLPHDTYQSDSGPKLFVAYGMQGFEEADSVTNLNVNINDAVYILMHAVEVKIQHQQQTRNKSTPEETDVSIMEEMAPVRSYRGVEDDSLGSAPNEESEADQRFSQTFRKRETSTLDQRSIENFTNMHKQNESTVSVSSMGKLQYPDRGSAAVIWDVFRRQDVPKLNTFLAGLQSSDDHHVRCSVYDQTYFLHEDQKRKLKNELGIEPWTFVQCVGEAVLIPAGCAFQSRNIKSSMQLAFDFLSPESLSKSMQLVQDIRCLPNDHVAKLQLLEVGKMPLYAASWTIREIQKIALDPKLGSELGFEDQNLTAMVADNLQRVSKRNQVACR